MSCIDCDHLQEWCGAPECAPEAIIMTCSLNTCNKLYNAYEPGESLLGDLNFCSDKCNCIWIARNERASGKYLVETREWCDQILGGPQCPIYVYKPGDNFNGRRCQLSTGHKHPCVPQY